MMTSSTLALIASEAAAAGEHGADHAKGGLPQLNFDTFPTQIFWLVVGLVVLFWLMSKVALPRIASVLEERADAIASDLDQADEFKRKAEEAEAAYNQALADARAKSQEIAADTRAVIQKDVDAAMAKADAEISARTAEGEKRIAQIRESAMSSVEEVASETAQAVMEAVMPDMADADAVKKAVQSRMGG